MRIGQVIGTVTLSHAHPALRAGTFKIVVPFNLEQLQARKAPKREALIALDPYGAGEGSLVAFSEGPEAAQPFRPELKPLDASVAVVLDHVELGPLPNRKEKTT